MLQDFRFALRQLSKAPGFTLIAILTLAVGIGSATVVFSAINAMLFKPLPLIAYPEDRLLYATQTDAAKGETDKGWNYNDYLVLRERATTLAGLWMHSDLTVILAGRTEPERLLGTKITWDAFDLMGVPPSHGRLFNAADSKSGADQVALISHALWQRRYGSDPAAVGTSVVLNGQPTTIIGVMPPVWRYPDTSDVWFPLRFDDEKATLRGFYWFSGRARLKDGVTMADAQIEANTIMAALAREFPETNRGIGVKFRPLRLRGSPLGEAGQHGQDTGQHTLLLFCAVLFVFLISCVNVANLLLARSVTRTKEVAVRLALGADRSRIIRQLVTENVLLALCGGLGGLLLALWGNDGIRALIPVDLPFWLRFDFDLRVFGFVFFLSVVSGLIFGFIPAFKASRPDVISELKEGGRTAEADGPRARRLRNGLVIAEVALALVLLVGAGLMMRSFLELRRTDPGFDRSNVLTFRTGYPENMVREDPGAALRFFAALPGKLAALPGVKSVALASSPPGTDGGKTHLHFDGQPEPAHPGDASQAYMRIVSPSYFATARIPLKAGRLFTDQLDCADKPPAALVDETFASQHFGGSEAAIGKRIRYLEAKDGNPPGWLEIVGVVGNVRHQLDRAKPAPTFYRPVAQEEANFLTVLVRIGSYPAGYAAAAREAVQQVDPRIPIYHVLTLEQVVMRSVWPRLFFSDLFTVFGLVALFLACIGIYGVMSYNVTQRTQEIGMRMALGAQSSEVVRMVVRQGVQLVGWGLGTGLFVALLLADSLAAVLYGVSPRDPPTFAVVPMLLAAVALFACWLPSRRATRIEPLAALRTE